MFPLMIKMHLHTLLIVFLVSLAYGQDRKIIAENNPGCPQCLRTTLIYIKAEGPDDTIHQIWDFTRGMPSVLYAIGKPGSFMNVTWEDDMNPVKFNFTERPTYSFAAVIDKVVEYEDCHDKGHFDQECRQRHLSLDRVSWKRSDMVLSSSEAMLHLLGLYSGRIDTGLIDIKLDLLPFKDYAVDLPHLIHTANSTLIDVSLVNFTTSYNASRYAIHFVMASTDDSRDSMIYTMRKSLDDEHTPGVFEIIELRTPKSRTSESGGFMQFRPVGYTEPARSVSSSTNAYISNFNRTSIPKHSTLKAFYQDFDDEDLLIQDMFISFGLPGDGYYKQHNYSSWSFTYGYGSPPVESVSMFVIIIIAIGLGVPVLLAASGITYVLVRRYKQRHHARFTDSD